MTADREQRGREIQQDTWRRRRRRSSTGGWFCYCAGCESFQDENDDEDEDEYDNGTMTMTIMVMVIDDGDDDDDDDDGWWWWWWQRVEEVEVGSWQLARRRRLKDTALGNREGCCGNLCRRGDNT
ncbi:uncharacterized protein BDCG_00207 [Blastomyces dermatitidis ER-3]|uniref:Uncharacterized protein n=2 Tax=Ajellomyces dermatitidis TaxID=5039 RepID=F2TF48_AJEDA|nr:uncharacterized protein BDCG_00207 [Blastomyces dermatitidis ER-3]EEQ83402.2 hypothetical protein BDCG_00207 [Blastomyces dermatitidis ER-3]EGE81861.1 hypothetical protein BDDG_04804 [Blastomyces dermatitidis ATCC 18188]